MTTRLARALLLAAAAASVARAQTDYTVSSVLLGNADVGARFSEEARGQAGSRLDPQELSVDTELVEGSAGLLAFDGEVELNVGGTAPGDTARLQVSVGRTTGIDGGVSEALPLTLQVDDPEAVAPTLGGVTASYSFLDGDSCGGRRVIEVAVNADGAVAETSTADNTLRGGVFYDGACGIASGTVTMACADETTGSATTCTRGGAVACTVNLDPAGTIAASGKSVRPLDEFEFRAQSFNADAFSLGDESKFDMAGRDIGYARCAASPGAEGFFALGHNADGRDAFEVARLGDTAGLFSEVAWSRTLSLGEADATSAPGGLAHLASRGRVAAALVTASPVLDGVYDHSRAGEVPTLGGAGGVAAAQTLGAVVLLDDATGDTPGDGLTHALLYDAVATGGAPGVEIKAVARDADDNLWVAFHASGPLPPALDPTGAAAVARESFDEGGGALSDAGGAWEASSDTGDARATIETDDGADADGGFAAVRGSAPGGVGLRLVASEGDGAALAPDAMSAVAGDAFRVEVRLALLDGERLVEADEPRPGEVNGLVLRLGFDSDPESDGGFEVQLAAPGTETEPDAGDIKGNAWQTRTAAVVSAMSLDEALTVGWSVYGDGADGVEFSDVLTKLRYVEVRASSVEEVPLAIGVDSFQIHRLRHAPAAAAARPHSGVVRLAASTAGAGLEEQADFAVYPRGTDLPTDVPLLGALCAHPTDAGVVYSVFSAPDGSEEVSTLAVYRHDAAGGAALLTELSYSSFEAAPVAHDCAVDGADGSLVLVGSADGGAVVSFITRVSSLGFELWRDTLVVSTAGPARVALDPAGHATVVYGADPDSLEVFVTLPVHHAVRYDRYGNNLGELVATAPLAGPVDQRDVCVGASLVPVIVMGASEEDGTAVLTRAPAPEAVARRPEPVGVSALAARSSSVAAGASSTEFTERATCPRSTDETLFLELRAGFEYLPGAARAALASASLTPESVSVDTLFGQLVDYETHSERTFDADVGGLVAANAETTVDAAGGKLTLRLTDPDATARTVGGATTTDAADVGSILLGLQARIFIGQVFCDQPGISFEVVLRPTGFAVGTGWRRQLTASVSTGTDGSDLQLDFDTTSDDTDLVDVGGWVRDDGAPSFSTLFAEGGGDLEAIDLMFEGVEAGVVNAEIGSLLVQSSPLFDEVAPAFRGTTAALDVRSAGFAAGDQVTLSTDNCDTEAAGVPRLTRLATGDDDWSTDDAGENAIAWPASLATGAYSTCLAVDGRTVSPADERGVQVLNSPWLAALTATDATGADAPLSPLFDAGVHLETDVRTLGVDIRVAMATLTPRQHEFDFAVTVDGTDGSELRLVPLAADPDAATEVDMVVRRDGATVATALPSSSAEPIVFSALPLGTTSIEVQLTMKIPDFELIRALYRVTATRTASAAALLLEASTPVDTRDEESVATFADGATAATLPVALGVSFAGDGDGGDAAGLDDFVFQSHTTVSFFVSDGATVAGITDADGAAVDLGGDPLAVPLAMPAQGTSTLYSVTVVAEDGVTSGTFFLTLEAVVTLPFLAAVEVTPEGGAAVEAVASSPFSWEVSVPFEAANITVTPSMLMAGGGTWELIDDDGDGEVLGGPFADAAASGVFLNLADGVAGTHSYGIDVTPDGGSDFSLETNLLVTRALSTLRTLDGIVVAAADESGEFTPNEAIDAELFSYTVTVPRDLTSVFVDARATSEEASVLGLGDEVALPEVNVPVAVTITVRPADFATSGLESVYTVAITREPLREATLVSVDVTSDALRGSASWTEAGTTAEVSITDATSTLSLLVATESEATLRQATRVSDGEVFDLGAVASGGSAVFDAPTGGAGSSDSYTLSVLAEDGETAATYTLLVHVLGTDAEISAAQLVPAAASGLDDVEIASSEVSLPFEGANATLRVELADATGEWVLAEVAADGESGDLEFGTLQTLSGPHASGEESAALPTPSAGLFSFFVYVRPAAGDSFARVHSLNVTRELSAVSTLASLSLAETDGGAAVALSPAFASGTASYEASVVREVDSVTLAAVATSSEAAVAISEPASDGVLELGTVGEPVTASVTVTAADGSASVYTVAVTRLPSADTALGSVSVAAAFADGDALAVDVSSLELELPEQVFEARVSAAAASEFSAVTVNGVEVPAGLTAAEHGAGALVAVPAGGSASVTLEVTAEDGSTTATRTLRLSRPARTDPPLDLTFSTPSVALPQAELPASAAAGNVAFFCGGRELSASGEAGDPLASCAAVSSTGAVTLAALESGARADLAGAGAGSFFTLFAGGQDSAGAASRAVDVFRVDGSTFAAATAAASVLNLGEARSHLAGVTGPSGAVAYFAGGQDAAGLASCAVDRFEASGSASATAALSALGAESLGVCRLGAAAAVAGDLVLFAGGLTAAGGPATAAVEAWNEATGAWVSGVRDLSEARYGIAAASSGSAAFFAGGWTSVDGDHSRAVDVARASSSSSTGLEWNTVSEVLARAGGTAFYASDHFVVYGGYAQSCPTSAGGEEPCGEGDLDEVDAAASSDALGATPRAARPLAVSAGSAVSRTSIVTAVADTDSLEVFRATETSVAASSTRRRSDMGATAPVVGGRALLAGGRTGSAGGGASALAVLTPQEACASLSFCHGNGVCVGTPPLDSCTCFGGYEGAACSRLSGSAFTTARTISVVTTVTPAAVAVGVVGVSVTTAAAGQAVSVGMMPLMLYMQQFIMPVAHNAELTEVYNAFRAMNAVALNSPSDGVGTEADGNVMEYSHGLGRKLCILVGFALVAAFLSGKLVHVCVFRTVLHSGHFVFLYVLLIVPVAESLFDLPGMPDWAVYATFGGIVLLLWLFVLAVVRPRLTHNVRLHIMRGRGWRGMSKKYRYVQSPDSDSKKEQSLAAGFTTRRLRDQWRDTKERLQNLEVRFAVMEPPRHEPDESEQNVNMYATQSYHWWRVQKKQVVSDRDLEAPVEYQEDWMRDSWQRFAYKYFFDTVVIYRQPGDWAVRRWTAHWWLFISSTYLLAYTMLAILFTGEQQLLALIIAGSSYIFLTLVIFPFRTGFMVENLLMHTTLLVQITLFLFLVRDKERLEYLFAVCGLQLAILPIKFVLKGYFTDEERYAEHREAAREEDLGKPAKPSAKMMRSSSSHTLRRERQKKKIRKKRRRKRGRHLERSQTGTGAINVFAEV